MSKKKLLSLLTILPDGVLQEYAFGKILETNYGSFSPRS